MTSTVSAQQVTQLLELVERFAARAEALGVRIHRVAALDEVAAIAAALAEDGGPAAFPPPRGDQWSAILAPSLDNTHPALRQFLTARGVPLVAVDTAHPTTASVGIALGISAADYGIAETGSLIVADNFPDRLVRMLAPKHIALLNLADLLPGLDQAGERLQQLAGTAAGRYISFITGPSRTADIEMSLTVGAHGPAELHIAIIGAAQG